MCCSIFQISARAQNEICAKYQLAEAELSTLMAGSAADPEVQAANQRFVEAQQEFFAGLGLIE